jgi:hypothetical protein
VGNEPYALAYDPSKGEVFVASYSNGAEGTVSVLADTSAPSSTSAASTTPSGSVQSSSVASTTSGSSSSLSSGFLGVAAIDAAVLAALALIATRKGRAAGLVGCE